MGKIISGITTVNNDQSFNVFEIDKFIGQTGVSYCGYPQFMWTIGFL